MGPISCKAIRKLVIIVVITKWGFFRVLPLVQLGESANTDRRSESREVSDRREESGETLFENSSRIRDPRAEKSQIAEKRAEKPLFEMALGFAIREQRSLRSAKEGRRAVFR